MSYVLLFLSVVIGYVVVLYLQKKDKRNIEVFMAFSGGFLLSITVFELLPKHVSCGESSLFCAKHACHTAPALVSGGSLLTPALPMTSAR